MGDTKTQRLYFDTNIHISYWLDEMDGVQYAGYYAQQLKQEAIECKYTLVTSRLVESELTEKFPFLKTYWDEETSKLIEIKKLEVVKASEADRRRAGELLSKHTTSGLHFADALHLVLAMKWADVLVTRDKKLKAVADSYLLTALPEDLTHTS